MKIVNKNFPFQKGIQPQKFIKKICLIRYQLYSNQYFNQKSTGNNMSTKFQKTNNSFYHLTSALKNIFLPGSYIMPPRLADR